MAGQTTPPQRPAKTAPVEQQIWTTWTMLLWFMNSNYDPTIASILAQLAAITGGGSVDKNFVYNQLSASSTWNVAHNLGKFPAVTVVDTGNNELIPDINYVDVNNVTLSFGGATSGKAYFN